MRDKISKYQTENKELRFETRMEVRTRLDKQEKLGARRGAGYDVILLPADPPLPAFGCAQKPRLLSAKRAGKG